MNKTEITKSGKQCNIIWSGNIVKETEGRDRKSARRIVLRREILEYLRREEDNREKVIV